MADLFVKQAKEYADARPSYPPQLFQFIASKTPSHNLVWDVGTGSGQAAKSLAAIYQNVIATDASAKQLEFAPKIPNVRYQHTPSTMSMAELEKLVASEGSVDLVTIAQSLHWFDLATFYQQVKWLLKKPNGVIAAWCYYLPRVCNEVDTVLDEFYSSEVGPYWDPARKLVDKLYGSIDFPFEAVEGADHTGPFEFVTETLMDLDDFLTYIKSWSAYQTAKEKGVELLAENVVQKFKLAWGEDGKKVTRFPIYLRMGKVGNA
ncbi:putative methyltransferase DDB_G0268948 [Vigna radiata var. radiata]|uniref:Methyltransferase DDB_G0268948 n=1 Tax=Vigna radiata var. radiata TaxID=3916 RepID=A0A1S3T7I8_VIGRR|nr:putative methyltransferase DDB_G0268948 [Vigna radiata var. radiata]